MADSNRLHIAAQLLASMVTGACNNIPNNLDAIGEKTMEAKLAVMSVRMADMLMLANEDKNLNEILSRYKTEEDHFMDMQK